MDIPKGVTEEPSKKAKDSVFETSILEPLSLPNTSPLPPPPQTPPTITIHLKPNHLQHLLLDIWGVITSHTFRTDLYDYLESGNDHHLETFLSANFHTAAVERFLQAFVLRNIADRNAYPQLPIIGLADCCDDRRSKVAAIAKNLRLRLQLQKKDPTLVDGNIEALFNLVWMDGYKNKHLRPHAFPDVLTAFRRWTSTSTSQNSLLQLHSFASGPPENQRLFLAASTLGDLSPFITSSFDASSFAGGVSKKDPAMYRALLAKMGGKAAENSVASVLYLTDSPSKAVAAREAGGGLTAFIVRRPGNRRYQAKNLEGFTVLDSLEQLEFTTTTSSDF